MGLDMYAMRAPKELVGETEVDFNIPEAKQEQVQEFFYWRKHPDLHGWMEELYRRKGGVSEDFNCDSVVLSLEDLDALEAAINQKELPHTEGFFFGASSYDDDTKAKDLSFIQQARAAINEGDVVFYTSWW